MTLKDYLNTYDRFAADNGMELTQVTPECSVAEMTVDEARKKYFANND